MCGVDMSRGLMSCSMDRLKMHVHRRHSVRENVCTIIIKSTTVFFHMSNSVRFVCHVSVHMCESVRVSVYLCVCLCACVYLYMCLCVLCVYL